MLSSDNAEILSSEQSENSTDHKNESVYLLPDNERETDRLKIQHENLKNVFGGIFNAPVHKELEEGVAVFDAGCGPGQWVIEMSKEYPRSTFVGFDLSDSFPSQDNRPPNCEFKIHNILDPLPFPDCHFGLIHQQYLTLGIPDNQWPVVLKDFARTLTPGGYIELTEPVLAEQVNMGPKASALFGSLQDVMAGKGITAPTSQKLEHYLTNAGFINISVHRGLMPMLNRDELETRRRNVMNGTGPIIKPLIVQNNPELSDPVAFERFVTEALEECIELNSSNSVYRIYGQKPL